MRDSEKIVKLQFSERRTTNLKIIGGALVLFWILGVAVPAIQGAPQQGTFPWKPAKGMEDSYAGVEMCVMCHVEFETTFTTNPHAGAGSGTDHPSGDLTCETCHGPAMVHVDSGGDPDLIESFTEKATGQIVEACLTCHAGSARQKLFASSQHAAGGVPCTKCHSIHSPEIDDRLMIARPPDLCFTCHADVRAAFGAVERHGVHSSVNGCEDCHNPHGSVEPMLLNRPMVNGELCARCHIDKRGPFVFEHLPSLVEGCTVCHGPHGSGNRFMLKMNTTRELCISCHIEAPTFHNLADPRYRDCTTCHVSIHGSDSHRLFFRR